MESVYQKVWQDPYVRSYILKFIITPRCKNCICKLKSNETYYKVWIPILWVLVSNAAL